MPKIQNNNLPNFKVNPGIMSSNCKRFYDNQTEGEETRKGVQKMLYSHKGAIKIEKPQNIYYGMIFSFRIYNNVTSCLVKIQ